MGASSYEREVIVGDQPGLGDVNYESC
jgi:Raf kinase inhibitor-like YbhB/YbcL family protein